MGKQSARLYYRGKDHKDIYFQGKYHNAMIVRKEGDAEIVWRKLYDEGYFVYTAMQGTAILYPKYRIREYLSQVGETYYSKKYLARKYMYSNVGAMVSSDGKLWRMINGNSKELAVIPKGDGIVVCSTIGSPKREYTYYPILESGYPDEENALMIYSDADAGTATDNSIFNTAGITDFCLLISGSVGQYKAFAVDMAGNVYNRLFTTDYSGIGGCGCYNGMYYCAFSNIPNGGYVYVSNSIGGTWERRDVPLKASEVYTIQSDEGIVVYLNRINDSTYGAVHIYTTTDFINYTKVDIPERLTVPIISQIYHSEKEYINFMLAYGSQEIDNAYNLRVYSFAYSYLQYMSRNKICYIENCKINQPKGMIVQFYVTLINMKKAQVTIYLDNLFLQESEGNFAFFEDLYPEEFMNDYLDKKGE